jgi:hypothetical protein
MVEIEIGVMVSQCLDRRIPSKSVLVKEVKAWERSRNRAKSRIKWLFSVEQPGKNSEKPILPAVMSESIGIPSHL